jgi:hypothetical protein
MVSSGNLIRNTNHLRVVRTTNYVKVVPETRDSRDHVGMEVGQGVPLL